MIPSVEIAKTDGNLSVASGTERILAIIGAASAGRPNVAYTLTSKTDIVSTFGGGELAEAGVYAIGQNCPVVLLRADASMPGSYGTIDVTGIQGTAVVTAGATEPDNGYDVKVQIVAGGTLGEDGITFIYSLDGGVNWSSAQRLGTLLTLACDSGVSFALGAAGETFVDGDTWSVTTTGPQLNSSDVQAAYDGLTDYSGLWLRALVLADADTTMLAGGDAFVRQAHKDGQYAEIMFNLRARKYDTEDRPTYQAYVASVVSQVQSTEVSVCADCCETVSGISGRRLRMRPAVGFAVRTVTIDDSQDSAAKSLGALPSVFLQTADGETRYHDERRWPGLDDLGVTTLRTWGGKPISPGTYVTNGRLLSGAGSDFRYFQLSAILNRVIETTFSLLQIRLSQSVPLNDEGTPKDDAASAIEDAILADLRTQYVTPRRVSNVKFALSRTDNLLTTDTWTFSLGVVPLGYVKKFVGKAGLVRVIPSQ